ncbi:MAG TPA: hypothetical protein VN783_17365 [Thermoanaerobaculia bacterium]|nr:hypothetical protein [Thermoanaerobaculia bacterium]
MSSSSIGPERSMVEEKGSMLSLGLGTACLLVVIAFAWKTAGIAIDDFYITYRYALHLAQGQGFVFNLGEPVFGLTNPGFGLVLAGLRVLTGARIELLATVVFALGLLGIVICLVLDRARREDRPEVLAGGLLLASSAFVWKAQGSEVSLALCLLLASAVLFGRLPFVAGLIGGFAVWVRPDAALGLAILCALLASHRKSIPWRWALGSALAILAGVGAAFWSFGTFIPTTFESKRSLAGITGGSGFFDRGFWEVGLGVWRQLTGRLGFVLLFCGLLGLVRIFRRSGVAGRLLAGYGLANALVYPALGVPFSIWYVFPFASAVFFGAAAFGFGVWDWIREARATEKTGPILAGILALALLLTSLADSAAFDLRWWRGFADLPRQAAYREAALWIRGHSAPRESIAFGEIGVIGYWSDRQVEDLMGLVTPRSLPFVARRDPVGAFLAHPTEIVLFHSTRRSTRAMVERKWFRRAYAEAARFPQSDGEGAVVVFRRRPGSSLPPPRGPRG